VLTKEFLRPRDTKLTANILHLPRLIVSSDRSGSGKTLISSGIMAALAKRLKVRGYKAGPDFIDGGYHRLATGRPSINLDLFMMGEEGVRRSLVKYSRGFDLAVIEGVMGLYDGHGMSYSTFQLSKTLKTPIVLVVDCSAMGSTVGAIVYGLKSYAGADVKGVIFNRISSEGHFNYCASGVKDVKILGYIPFVKDIKIPSRHLGLFTTETLRDAERIVKEVASLVESYVDLDSVMEVAESAGKLELEPESHESPETKTHGVAAVAYDQAFSFYYEENLDRLRERYELRFFSPLENERVEDADFIYIGGGYPELFTSELSSAHLTKKWILDSASSGVPILAECGGLMYLSRYIKGQDQTKRDMVGLYDIGIFMTGKLTLGYRSLKSISPNMLADEGDSIRGHEFHYSAPEYVNESRFAFKTSSGKGIKDGLDGAITNNAIALYTHLHFSNIKKRTVF
jgi:cobyrinic acid a,c-diamide synthase